MVDAVVDLIKINTHLQKSIEELRYGSIYIDLTNKDILEVNINGMA